MTSSPTRLYTTFVGLFLLLQGVSTLAFRLVPALDRAFPALLATTRMVAPHSALHILTGLLAVAILARGRPAESRAFAFGFGLFYIGLAIIGMATGRPHAFGLQPFDHPIHVFLGALGLLAWWMERRRGLIAFRGQAGPAS